MDPMFPPCPRTHSQDARLHPRSGLCRTRVRWCTSSDISAAAVAVSFLPAVETRVCEVYFQALWGM